MAENVKNDIFISYRRKAGGLETAGRIRDRLKGLGYSVFMDLHNMKTGEKFPLQIKNAIENCKDFILVLPPDAEDSTGKLINALESYWVRYEICYALSLNKHIIPVQMDGYFFPEKDKFPDIPEELKSIEKERFVSVAEIDGINFHNEVFDECFAKLKKALISRRKWKMKKKICIASLIAICCLGILTIGKCLYNKYLPAISFSYLPDNDQSTWNVGYVISNKDGKMSNGSVTPKLRLSINLVSKFDDEIINALDNKLNDGTENVYDKQGHLEIEFYDFYKEGSYSLDDENNSVTIKELYADNLAYYIEKLEDELEKSNLYIDMYSIQTIFEIKYTDQFRFQHIENYGLENNYNYLWTSWGTESSDYEGLQRYMGDNMIVWMPKKVEDALISEKINLDKDVLDFDIQDTAKYIKKHKKKILNTNVYGNVEVDNNGNEDYMPAISGGKAIDIIEDEYGLGIGLHLLHDNCVEMEYEWYEFPMRVFNELRRW